MNAPGDPVWSFNGGERGWLLPAQLQREKGNYGFSCRQGAVAPGHPWLPGDTASCGSYGKQWKNCMIRIRDDLKDWARPGLFLLVEIIRVQCDLLGEEENLFTSRSFDLEVKSYHGEKCWRSRGTASQAVSVTSPPHPMAWEELELRFPWVP